METFLFLNGIGTNLLTDKQTSFINLTLNILTLSCLSNEKGIQIFSFYLVKILIETGQMIIYLIIR
jgi:hypothetical protein